MNILIAPDSFKGTLEADEVCRIIGSAFQGIFPDANIVKLPLSDGGEGLCSCLYNAGGGQWRTAFVSGVFGKKTKVSYLIINGDTAVIEMASCAGLPLAGDRKNPLTATAFGVGELINHARKFGAEKILLGLGGSATNECGASMASALGYKFLDKDGTAFVPTGGTLLSVAKIIPPEKPLSLSVTAACDVDNPLFGKNGAAYVFSPQKGADENGVRLLDRGLRHISGIIERDLHKDVKDIKGAGAAGGMGAGAVAFLGASLERGIDIILSASSFCEKAENADLIITGEGKLDSQSVNGKVISGVAKRASLLRKPLITVCGCHGDGFEEVGKLGALASFRAVSDNRPFDEIQKTCREDLLSVSEKAALYIKNTI